MTAASTRIVSSPSRNTRIALLMTTVVWLEAMPGRQRGRIGRPALRVPAEHDDDHGDGEHDRRPDVEAQPFVGSFGHSLLGAFCGFTVLRHATASCSNP